jgi:hypothetical protein
METAFVQKDAAVNLDSVTHTLEFLYQRAAVKNVSDRTVQAVTFGVLLHDTDNPGVAPILAASRTVQIDIKPGELRDVEINAFPRDDAQSKAAVLKSSGVKAEFGVLGVQFDDGGSWEFDWRPVGAFAAHGGTGLASTPVSVNKNCGPEIGWGRAALYRFASFELGSVLAQGYTCVGTPNNEMCTNNGTSCTNSLCHKFPACANQVCQLIP